MRNTEQVYGQVIQEDMSFKEKVYGRTMTTDEDRSQ